jgi:hypothetical protein
MFANAPRQIKIATSMLIGVKYLVLLPTGGLVALAEESKNRLIEYAQSGTGTNSAIVTATTPPSGVIVSSVVKRVPEGLSSSDVIKYIPGPSGCCRFRLRGLQGLQPLEYRPLVVRRAAACAA